MSTPKWTEERTAQLESIVGSESPVTLATVASAADELETTPRSISSKLRKMGFDVEKASAAPRSYSEEQEATLRAFLESNSGEYTYAEIADTFENGAFSAKSIQGKILSMELTDHVKPTPKVEAQKSYSDAEEATVVKMIKDGAFVEAIAAAVGKSVNSVRGKALSLLRAGKIDSVPRTENVKPTSKEDPLADLGDIASMTVEAIADQIGKTVRGVKTMLTRRGLTAADYDGAAKKAKAAEAN